MCMRERRIVYVYVRKRARIKKSVGEEKQNYGERGGTQKRYSDIPCVASTRATCATLSFRHGTHKYTLYDFLSFYDAHVSSVIPFVLIPS